ncbi:hypothetical protein CISIN_1g042805mg [Citrus sinensis]|uniref:Uncharacterized protein n=1 Tax=Citrus sinensis TaxID=2711 RepID=A0A067ENR5_CITSI|nr:hypothetical protein CISIN_1g042805mg [Citrus sinensis]
MGSASGGRYEILNQKRRSVDLGTQSARQKAYVPLSSSQYITLLQLLLAAMWGPITTPHSLSLHPGPTRCNGHVSLFNQSRLNAAVKPNVDTRVRTHTCRRIILYKCLNPLFYSSTALAFAFSAKRRVTPPTQIR